MTQVPAVESKRGVPWTFGQLVEYVGQTDNEDAAWMAAMFTHKHITPPPDVHDKLRFQLYQRISVPPVSASSWSRRAGAPVPPMKCSIRAEAFGNGTLCPEHVLQTLLDRKSRCMPGTTVDAVAPSRATMRLLGSVVVVIERTKEPALWIICKRLEGVGIPLPVRIVSPQAVPSPQFAGDRRVRTDDTIMKLEVVAGLGMDDYCQTLAKALLEQEQEIRDWYDDASVVACGVCMPNAIRFAYVEHKAKRDFHLPRTLDLPAGVARYEWYFGAKDEHCYPEHSWREFLQVLYAEASKTANTATSFLRKSFCKDGKHVDRKAMDDWIDTTWTTYLREDGWTFSPKKREVDGWMHVLSDMNNSPVVPEYSVDDKVYMPPPEGAKMQDLVVAATGNLMRSVGHSSPSDPRDGV